MNDDIIILDDFLPTYLQDFLEELCYHIDWRPIKNSTFHEDVEIGNKFTNLSLYKDEGQLVHTFWSTIYKDSITDKPLINFSNHLDLSHYFHLPLQIATIKNKWNFSLENNFKRGKVNMTFSGANTNPIPKFPHIDYEINDIENSKKWAIIYYVNESDGDTIVYNEKEWLEDLSKYTIKKKISPKKGRIIFIKGDLFHSASIPSSKYSKRIVINYNLEF